MNWHELGLNWFALADDNGKILGEVKLGYRTWSANSNGKQLGEYLTEHQAKSAVANDRSKHD